MVIAAAPMQGLGGYALAALATLLVTGAVVLIHYRGLEGLAHRYGGRRHPRHRSAMLVIIFALLGLHVLEIVCYGAAYWGLDQLPGIGLARGVDDISLFDGIYLSDLQYGQLRRRFAGRPAAGRGRDGGDRRTDADCLVGQLHLSGNGAPVAGPRRC